MNNSIRLLLLAICVLVVLPFFLLGWYNHPSGDDFIAEFLFNRNAFIDVLYDYYATMGGRYSAYILGIPVNHVQFFNPYCVILVTWIQLCLYILFWFLITLLIDQHFELKYGKLPIFTILIIYGFCYLPGSAELLYWLSAAWIYLPSLVAIATWALIRFSIKETHTLISKLGFVVLPFIIAGLVEFNILFMLFLFIIPNRIHPQLSKLRGIMYFLFALGVVITLLSTGNNYRAETLRIVEQPPLDLFYGIKRSLMVSLHHLNHWSRSTPLLLIPVIMLFLINNNHVALSLKKVIGISILSILLYLFLAFPYFYGTGYYGLPDRVADFLFITMILIFVFSGTTLLLNRIGSFEVPLSIPMILIAFIFWNATIDSRYNLVFKDLKHIKDYTIQYDDLIRRTKIAAKTNPGDTLIVPPLMYTPSSMIWLELSKNSNHYYNISYSNYYGIAGIKVDSTP
jgi:hypothetical protein